MKFPRFCQLLLILLWLGVPVLLSAAENSRKLGSVGLQVVPTATGELVVLQIPGGTPAAASGIRPGDLIVQIDEFRLVGSDFADVVSHHLWGPEGSRIVIHYLRPGEAGKKSATMRRAPADPKLTVSPAVHNDTAGTKQGGSKK